MNSRRDVLKKLFGTPWILGLKLQPVSQDAGLAHRRLGIQVLRFLNTAQHWHKSRTGRHADLMTVVSGPGVAAMRGSESAITAGLGASFIDRLDLNGAEIVPGWRLHFTLVKAGTGYAAVLEDTSATGVGHLVTDTRGVIQDQTPIRAAHQAVSPRGVMARSVAYLATLSGGLAEQYSCDPSNQDQDQCAAAGMMCACWNDICCVPLFSWCQSYYCDGCINCGCASCVWACSGFCW